ncbi:MAG: hypothetical protein A2X57_05445 [Nitrospirae bacterium GWD2_57_8]|nr:MAG: hypothetical protein A2X57_05445 [Nitrospirae bacterium GWD2_57_8]
MSLIRRLLDSAFFSRTKEPASFWRVIAWWEVRRIPYNLIVGAAGVATSILAFLSAVLAEHVTGIPAGLPDPPIFALFGILIYAVLANACYTGGWIAEILVAKVWGESGRSFGVISFALGLFFSVLFTLFIGALIAGFNGLQILLQVTGHASID